MQNITIATLIGLFLSTSALATPVNPGTVQSVKSFSNKAASTWIYVNRLPAPNGKPGSGPTLSTQTPAQQLNKQL